MKINDSFSFSLTKILIFMRNYLFPIVPCVSCVLLLAKPLYVCFEYVMVWTLNSKSLSFELTDFLVRYWIVSTLSSIETTTPTIGPILFQLSFFVQIQRMTSWSRNCFSRIMYFLACFVETHNSRKTANKRHHKNNFYCPQRIFKICNLDGSTCS